MSNDIKFSNTLTVVLIIALILVASIVGVVIFKAINAYDNKSEAELVATVFEQREDTNKDNNNSTGGNIDLSGIESINIITDVNSGQTTTKYKGFKVVATIQIPAINLKYPVLEKVTKTSLETSVVLLYTAHGINEIGNTVFIGHNNRNGTMMSDVKKLKNGDIIYVTDTQGRKVKYIIYETKKLSGNDGNYITRDTNGKREISLSTCTDDSKARTVVFAREG